MARIVSNTTDVIQKCQKKYSLRLSSDSGLILCGGFNYSFGMDPEFINERFIATGFVELLRNANQLVYGTKICDPQFKIQRDYAPIHGTTIKNLFMNNKGFRFWRGQLTVASYPDLNVIEDVCGRMVKKICEDWLKFKTVDKPLTAIFRCVNQIPFDLLQRLIQSMPDRIFQGINTNAGETKY